MTTNPHFEYEHAARKRATKLYKNKWSTSQIAEELGCSTSTVQNWLRYAGVEMRARGRARKCTDAQVRKMIAMRAKGWTYADIGEQFGISLQTVRSYTKASE